MKNLLLLFIVLFCVSASTAQNIGIGTNNPLAKLDLRGKLAMNDSVLLLRGGDDPNHGLKYDASVDGPYLFGFNGGALGAAGSPNALQWDYLGNVNAKNDLLIERNLIIDNAAANNGTLSNGLNFGNGGEGIASNRTTAVNQYGLDFYTNNANRMSITNSGNIGIGINNPSYPLQFTNNNGDKLVLKYNGDPNKVTGLGTLGNYLIISGGDYFDQSNSIRLGYGSSSTGIASVLTVAPYPGKVGVNNNAPSATLDINGTFKLNDGTQGDGKVLTSDASGNASWQAPAGSQVYFLASRRFSDFTNVNDQFFILDSLWYNDGNAYNLATGVFTAPSDGLYFFYAQVTWSSAGNGGFLSIRKNNSYNGCSLQYFPPPVTAYDQSKLSAVFKLTAGETVDFQVAGSSTYTIHADYRNYTFVTGYKIY